MLATVCTVACAGSTSTGGSAAPSANPTQGTVTRTDAGCTLMGVAGPVKAGYITLTAVNETSATAGFDMGRITEPNTFQDFATYIEKDKQLAAAGQASLGHPAYFTDVFRVQLQPSKTGELYGSVRQGTYAIACFGQTATGMRPTALVGPIQVQ